MVQRHEARTAGFDGDDPVPVEDGPQFRSPVSSELVVVQPSESLERVAQREVPDVVQQRPRPRRVVVGCDVRGEGEDAEGVLEPGVGLRGHRSSGAGVRDELQPPHPPRAQEFPLQRVRTTVTPHSGSR